MLSLSFNNCYVISLIIIIHPLRVPLLLCNLFSKRGEAYCNNAFPLLRDPRCACEKNVNKRLLPQNWNDRRDINNGIICIPVVLLFLREITYMNKIASDLLLLRKVTTTYLLQLSTRAYFQEIILTRRWL